MEQAVSTINQFDFTKSQIAHFVEKVLSEVEDENPLDIIPKIKVMEEITKQLKEKLIHNLSIEADKYPEKTFEYHGVKFTKTNRAVYDYSGSKVWQQIKARLDNIQNIMKTIQSPMADAETGEIIYPAIKKESSSISVTLPK